MDSFYSLSVVGVEVFPFCLVVYAASMIYSLRMEPIEINIYRHVTVISSRFNKDVSRLMKYAYLMIVNFTITCN